MRDARERLNCSLSDSGWMLTLTDGDHLAGPFATRTQAAEAANLMEYDIDAAPITLRHVPVQGLFKYGDFWYRLVSHGKKRCVVKAISSD